MHERLFKGNTAFCARAVDYLANPFIPISGTILPTIRYFGKILTSHQCWRNVTINRLDMFRLRNYLRGLRRLGASTLSLV